MAENHTVQFYIEMLQKYEPTDKVAIPFIWFKDEVEETFEVKIADNAWSWIVNRYTDNDSFHEESFLVMGDYVAMATVKEEK
ncbi:hypothetical protein UFOVP536_58 [uncultured Caudovirales phage]|uniref:Uncharacterized protein n=1 Tax=uncultured Caudovirales phage TaxID=2100421 RepID=A0A6J5MRY4_9CAUD|nr:hypothetical protein UFOVP536_58 [uncultured Caudovirales phage]